MAAAEAARLVEIEWVRLAKEQEEVENRWKADEEKSSGAVADEELSDQDIRPGETLMDSVNCRLKAMGKEGNSSDDEAAGKRNMDKACSRCVSWKQDCIVSR